MSLLLRVFWVIGSGLLLTCGDASPRFGFANRYRQQRATGSKDADYSSPGFYDSFHLPKFNHSLVDEFYDGGSTSKKKHMSQGSKDVKGGADDEDRLLADLFKVPTYNKSVRPVLKKNNPVQVVFGIAYVQLIALNEREQTLKSNVWIRQKWKNEILTWDPKKYGGITRLTVTKQLLWVPDLILYGSTGTSGLEQGLVESSLTKIEITSEGNHKWYTPVILTSSCSVDIRYFPFDNQKCVLRFGSWTHASDNINLTSADDTADTAFYLPSSDFKILGIPARRHIVQYEPDLAPFTDISFEIYLQRLPGFYVFNVIIPSVAIAILCLCVFAYPEDNSGRVGFVFACLLSLFVVAMMIASAMPVSSDHTPLLSLFMVLGMFQMTLAGMTNVIVLMFYKETGLYLAYSRRSLVGSPTSTLVGCAYQLPRCYLAFSIVEDSHEFSCPENLFLSSVEEIRNIIRGEDVDDRFSNGARSEVPSWLRNLCFKWLAPLVRIEVDIEKFNECKRNRLGIRNVYRSYDVMEPPRPSTSRDTRQSRRYHSEDSDTESMQFLDTREAQENILKNFEDYKSRFDEEYEGQYIKDFWKCISDVVDRIFFIAFVLSWIISVIIVYEKIPNRDDKAIA